MTDPVNQNTRLEVDSGRGAHLERVALLPATGGLRAAWDAALRPLVGALWPSRCLICGDPGQDGRDLCAHCDRQLPWSGAACHRCALPVPGTAPIADSRLDWTNGDIAEPVWRLLIDRCIAHEFATYDRTRS